MYATYGVSSTRHVANKSRTVQATPPALRGQDPEVWDGVVVVVFQVVVVGCWSTPMLRSSGCEFPHFRGVVVELVWDSSVLCLSICTQSVVWLFRVFVSRLVKLLMIQVCVC
jgi:hypothetical protein